MTIDTIEKIFDFLPETNLTEEYFYDHKGDYPVFSGQTEDNGIVACIDSFNQTKPCITFTTYGSAGKIYYREGNYTIGRNCMGLRPKKNYEGKVVLEWFSYEYQNKFYKRVIGDEAGQKSLNKLLLENLQIQLPDKNIQIRQLALYKKATLLSTRIKHELENIDKIDSYNIKIVKSEYNEKFDNIFKPLGGNSGLTEEFIYNNQARNDEEKLPVFSSATQNVNMMGYISKYAKLQDEGLKIFKSPCILVARNGYAGKMSLMTNGEFTTNDHAYVLELQKDWKEKVNLRWFMYQYQALFYNLVTSKSDNATFNTKNVENRMIDLPSKSIQDKIALTLYKIDKLKERLIAMQKQLQKLSEYEIT